MNLVLDGGEGTKISKSLKSSPFPPPFTIKVTVPSGWCWVTSSKDGIIFSLLLAIFPLFSLFAVLLFCISINILSIASIVYPFNPLTSFLSVSRLYRYSSCWISMVFHSTTHSMPLRFIIAFFCYHWNSQANKNSLFYIKFVRSAWKFYESFHSYDRIVHRDNPS